MKSGCVWWFANRVLIVVCMLVFLVATPMETVAASKDTGYIVEGNIPLFSFEDPVKLQVKVFDAEHREIQDAHVLFEIIPAIAPPPYGHDQEMGFMEKIMSGETGDPEVQGYLDYLNNMKVSQDKSLHKTAFYNPINGYYTVTHIFSRLPWGIRVYVAQPGGSLQKTDCFFPHRAHCAYIDVANIELVKTYLHQLVNLAKKQDWAATQQKYNSILASLNGKHGMYYMLRTHHGEDVSEFEQEMDQLQNDILQASHDSVNDTVGAMFQTMQEYEDYFEEIEVLPESSRGRSEHYEIRVWDKINQKGITGAVVVVQEDYDIDQEAINPAIVPNQPPDQGMYHAKISYIPQGIYAIETGDGLYAFESKHFMKNSSKRIFVYYALDLPGIPSKFITKEMNLKRCSN